MTLVKSCNLSLLKCLILNKSRFIGVRKELSGVISMTTKKPVLDEWSGEFSAMAGLNGMKEV